MARTRSRDALISPRPYSRMSSEDREIGTSSFDLRKTYSLPRRFAAAAASKVSSTTSPLIAPAILRESLSQLEKLDDENDSLEKPEEKHEDKNDSIEPLKCVSLPPETTLQPKDSQSDDTLTEAKDDDEEGKDDIKEEPIYGKIIKAEGIGKRLLIHKQSSRLL